LSARIGVAILAAGMGTRMKSRTHKVLHPVCGLPMAAHVLNAARSINPVRIAVVVGHQREAVEAALAAPDVEFVHQSELRGTGDAVARCRKALEGCDHVIVLNGDCPLIQPEMLAKLAAPLSTPVRLVTSEVPEMGRLGRLDFDTAGKPSGIVEFADDPGRSGPGVINAGQYAFRAAWLWEQINDVPLSAKGEQYLTHLVATAFGEGTPAETLDWPAEDVLGVDDRLKLAEAEALMRRRILERHMLNGVTITDPATTYIDATVELEEDVTIRPASSLEGRTRVAAGCTVGPGSTVRNSTVGADTTIESSTVEDSTIGARVHIGPYSHVRGNAHIGDDCQLGNYAEVKNSVLGIGVKMHHFSYMGDADIGDNANIAAGSITCNFDGVSKHRTVIGAGAFIGCDTMLIAPVTVGAGAFTATGSVITKDVADGESVMGVPARPFERKQAGSSQ